MEGGREREIERERENEQETDKRGKELIKEEAMKHMAKIRW